MSSTTKLVTVAVVSLAVGLYADKIPIVKSVAAMLPGRK